MNEYDILLDIFRYVRDYSTATYTLPQVCRGLVQHMKDAGYQVEIVDSKHHDYRIVQVEEHRYKIVRFPEWCRYDVQRSA